MVFLIALAMVLGIIACGSGSRSVLATPAGGIAYANVNKRSSPNGPGGLGDDCSLNDSGPTSCQDNMVCNLSPGFSGQCRGFTGANCTLNSGMYCLFGSCSLDGVYGVCPSSLLGGDCSVVGTCSSGMTCVNGKCVATSPNVSTTPAGGIKSPSGSGGNGGPGPGNPCNSGVCGSGSTCNGCDGKCYANAGTSCTNSNLCLGGANCIGGVCTQTALGGWCAVSSDCESPGTCTPHSNPCFSLFPGVAAFGQCYGLIGANCSSSGGPGCASGTCTRGVCS